MIYDGVYALTRKKRVGVDSYAVDEDSVHMFLFGCKQHFWPTFSSILIVFTFFYFF